MLDILKTEVEKQFGKKITYQKDCKSLSVSVLNKTGEYISPATLRRLYGLLMTNSNPSHVTLDILSRYCGNKNWDDFTKLMGKSHDINDINDLWNRIDEKAKKISLNTIDLIKNKSGIDFKATIPRKLTENDITYFINSNSSVYTIIGPGGYGKSTVLANWYLKKISRKYKDHDIVLFINSYALESSYTIDNNLEGYLNRILSINPDVNLIKKILDHHDAIPGRFIVIIDALDELNVSEAKLEKVFIALSNFIQTYSQSKKFKLILSTRIATWNLFKPFIISGSSWYNIDEASFTFNGANIPPLTFQEIQYIFDNTLNTKFAKKTFIEELNYELRETLTYPYFLQLFIEIYHPEEEYLYNDQFEVFREFLRKRVYYSQYADEKVDILNKIIEISDYGRTPSRLKKNTLKEIYPIHLKLAGNYYYAYEDLLSFGLINEESTETQYGGINRLITIANDHLFQIIAIQNIVDRNGGISFELFKKIESEFADHEYQIPYISLLYQLAYKERLVEPLFNFFELNPRTIEKIFKYPFIAIVLRKDEYMRKMLLPVYSKIPIAQKYLFYYSQDINHLVKSFKESLTYFSKNSSAHEDQLIASTLLTYSGILNLDMLEIEKYYPKIVDQVPSINQNQKLAGRWFSCMVLYESIILGRNPDPIIKNAFKYLFKLINSEYYIPGEFENSFFPSVILTNNNLDGIIPEEYFEMIKKKQVLDTGNTLIIYRNYFKILKNEPTTPKDLIEIERCIYLLNPLDNVHSKIIGLVVKALYFFYMKDLPVAYDNFKYAIELSHVFGYKLAEVKLLLVLSSVLTIFGETTKANECQRIADSIIGKSGIKIENI